MNNGKKYGRKLVWQILTGLFFCLLLTHSAWAVPGKINFQGALTAADGSRLADGSYSIAFALYNVPSGGTPLWSNTQTVELQHGVFSIELGNVGTPINGSIFSGDCYLGMTVEAETEMIPRQQILSVGYSFKAEDADTLDGMDSTEFGKITTVTAGVGLTGGGTTGNITINADTGTIQSRVSGNCAAGESIRIINSNGTVTCEPDSDSGGDITGVTAGTGLSGGGSAGGVTISADTSALQSRVAGSCIAGQSIRIINSNGTVTCETDDNSGGDITSVTAGTGLSGGGTSGSVILNVNIPFIQSSSASGGLLDMTSTSSTGTAVKGEAIATGSVTNIGGWFSAAGDVGYGVFGRADGANGHAVHGYTPDSTDGIAVYATSYDLAVYGMSRSYGPTRGYLGIQGKDDFDGILSADWNGLELGGAGISTGTTTYDNYGLLGHSNGTGVRGEYSENPAQNYGELGTNGTGVYGRGTTYGIRATSSTGTPLHAAATATGVHAAAFYHSYGIGLNGATLYTNNNNSSGQGIALHAKNDNTASTDATAVLSNDGLGALLKGFGGNGGNEEFRIDNNGSFHIYDPSVADEALLFDAGSAALYLGSGSSTTSGDDGDLFVFNSAGTTTISLDGASGRTTTRELRITGGSDLSEQFDIQIEDYKVTPGMVVSIDPENPGRLMVSRTAYDNKVAGIVSGAGNIRTGMIMGQGGTVADGQHPVALTGRVYCMADATQGAIEPGDLLTTSVTPGHAMKVADHAQANGAIIGKAMTPLKTGEGLVLVLVSLQ